MLAVVRTYHGRADVVTDAVLNRGSCDPSIAESQLDEPSAAGPVAQVCDGAVEAVAGVCTARWWSLYPVTIGWV